MKAAIARLSDIDEDGFKTFLLPEDDAGLTLDNCPEDWNPEQTDSDSNGTGDACEAIQPTKCAGDVEPVDGVCPAPTPTCVPEESVITLTSKNDYYVLTHPLMGKQYQIKTTKVASDKTDTNDVDIEGNTFSLPLKQPTLVPSLPGIEIEVTQIWPAPVDHLRLAVRSVCE